MGLSASKWKNFDSMFILDRIVQTEQTNMISRQQHRAVNNSDTEIMKTRKHDHHRKDAVFTSLHSRMCKSPVDCWSCRQINVSSTSSHCVWSLVHFNDSSRIISWTCTLSTTVSISNRINLSCYTAATDRYQLSDYIGCVDRHVQSCRKLHSSRVALYSD